MQTRLPKTKCVWPMKINVICTVHLSIYIMTRALQDLAFSEYLLTLLLISHYKNNLKNECIVYNLVQKVVLLEILWIVVNDLIFY